MARSEKKPAKYWLSNPAEKHLLPQAGDLTKLRWRIEPIIRNSNKSRPDISKDRLARLPSPRHAVHRGLRIPGPEERIPPHDLVTPLGSKNLPFPKVIDPEAPPPRPNATSQLDRDDAQKIDHRACQTLSRCPLLRHAVAKGSRRKKFMTQ